MELVGKVRTLWRSAMVDHWKDSPAFDPAARKHRGVRPVSEGFENSDCSPIRRKVGGSERNRRTVVCTAYQLGCSPYVRLLSVKRKLVEVSWRVAVSMAAKGDQVVEARDGPSREIRNNLGRYHHVKWNSLIA